MAKWELNIGNVEYYDSFDRKSLKGNLSIKYNSDEHFKVTLFLSHLQEKQLQPHWTLRCVS